MFRSKPSTTASAYSPPRNRAPRTKSRQVATVQANPVDGPPRREWPRTIPAPPWRNEGICGLSRLGVISLESVSRSRPAERSGGVIEDYGGGHKGARQAAWPAYPSRPLRSGDPGAGLPQPSSRRCRSKRKGSDARRALRDANRAIRTGIRVPACGPLAKHGECHP